MNIKNSIERGFDTFFAFLPNVLGFLVILIVGYLVAKVVGGLVSKALGKANLDEHMHKTDAHGFVERIMPGASVERGVGRVVFWLVFAFFFFAAVGALKIPAVTGFMNQVLAYLPNVIVAMLIFVVAALVSGAVAAGVTKVMGETPTGKIVAGVVPAIVMTIAIFMILDQLQIAEQIVTITFAAIMGALALGLALAFGLGGRDVAGRMLEDAYRKGQQAKDQAKSDMEVPKARAEEAMSGNSSGYSNPPTSTFGSSSTGNPYGS